MSKRATTVVGIVASIAVFGGGVAYHLQQRAHRDDRSGDTSATVTLPALAPAPLSVTLSPFFAEGRALLGSAPLVSVSALGDPISEIRLYDGDALVGRHTFAPDAGPATTTSFSWPAVREGRHVLHAVAVGADPGLVAHSAPTRVEVVGGFVTPTTFQLPANGLTIEEAAATAGVDPSALSSTDTGFAIDAADVAPAPTPPASTDATAIAAALNGCSATITLAASALGDDLVVYETGGSGPGFTARGTVSTSAALVTADLTPGTHVFVAGPAGAPAITSPVAVTAPATCLADLWDGGATLLDGLLTLPRPTAQVWAYVGIGGRPFVRIPAEGTIAAPTGTADLASVLPALLGTSGGRNDVRLEVWQPGGPAGSPATLVARSTADVTNDALRDLIGESVAVNLFPGEVVLLPGDTSVDLQWDAGSGRVDQVLWQVLTQPIGGDNRDTAPPAMIATGVAGITTPKGVDLDDTPEGDFTIDLTSLLADRAMSEAAGAITPHGAPALTTLTGVTSGTSLSATPIDLAALVVDDALVLVPPVGAEVWVRVLPLASGIVIGPASNLTTVSLPDPDAVVPITFTADSVEFDPGYGGNYELAGCVRVTSVPWTVDSTGRVVPSPGGGVVDTVISTFYATPQTYCPHDWDPAACTGVCAFVDALAEGLNAVVGALAEVWDVVASAYNGLIELAVELGTLLNPYCLQGRVVGAVADTALGTDVNDDINSTCEKIARVATKAVISAVLTSFGLPPSLPTSEQLVQLAKGNIEVLAVEYLKSLGVPCDEMTLSPEEAQLAAAGVSAAGGELPDGVDPTQGVDLCASMVRGAIGEVTKVVQQAVQQQVAAATGMPMPSTAIPGFDVMLEPRAHYSGATIRVNATPSVPQLPAGVQCRISAKGNAGNRTTGSMEYTESLHLPIASGYLRQTLDFATFQPVVRGAIHLDQGSDLHEGNQLSITLSSDTRCMATIVSPASQPVKPPLGRWTPGDLLG